MLNSRSIPPELWEQARQALVFYFLRRHGSSNAEDLAQETLMAIWSREDYTFEREEDFLRVCYGFAARISRWGHRQAQKHVGGGLDPAATPAPGGDLRGLTGTEVKIFLDEVCRTGESGLADKDWKLIQSAAGGDRANMPVLFDLGDANNFRVYLHRIRRKLARLTGWRSK